MVVTKFKQMLQDEGAVSPVIGVILMVAVTVVLGAVIGAFVFGIGDKLSEPAPNAQLEFDYDSSTGDLEVVHDGGDSITADNTGTLAITGDATVAATSVDSSTTGAPFQSGDVIFGSAGGDELASGVTLSSGDVVEVQWVSNGGDQSSTLGTFEAP